MKKEVSFSSLLSLSLLTKTLLKEVARCTISGYVFCAKGRTQEKLKIILAFSRYSVIIVNVRKR